MDCHGAARLAMTKGAVIAPRSVGTPHPVIASVARQSKNVDQSAALIRIQALWRVNEALDVHAGGQAALACVAPPCR
jgi:hypothetical protein